MKLKKLLNTLGAYEHISVYTDETYGKGIPALYNGYMCDWDMVKKYYNHKVDKVAACTNNGIPIMLLIIREGD